MARDGVFPFSHYLRWIFEPTKTPLANVLFVFIIDSILLLLQLVSKSAFAAIIAIATLGYQISYLIPIFFRCTTARHTFIAGEFNLGRFGVPVAIVSSIWLSITSIIMLFPANYPTTKDNMNYAIVVVGGVILIASFYWIISARHWFVGPKRTDIDPIPLPPGHVTVEDVVKKRTMTASNSVDIMDSRL
jgi:amino acid transporter